MPHGPGGVSEPRWPHSLKANLMSLARQGHQSSLPLPPDQRGSAPLNQFTPTPSTGEKERLWAEGGLVPDLGLTRGAGPFRSLGGPACCRPLARAVTEGPGVLRPAMGPPQSYPPLPSPPLVSKGRASASCRAGFVSLMALNSSAF